MRTVVCQQCNESFAVPDDLARPHCMRCGTVIAPPDTNIATDAAPPKMNDAPAGAFADYPMQPNLPERWSSWEEFRATSPAVQRELLALVSRPLPDMRNMKTKKLPVDVPAELDTWSKPLGTIEIPGDYSQGSLDGANTRRFLCWLLFSVGAAFLALGIPCLFSDLDRERTAPSALVTIGLIAIALGGFLLVATTPNTATILWIFEEGVLIHRSGRTTVVPWENVEKLRVNLTSGRPMYWLGISHDLSVAISLRFSPEVMPLMEYVEMRLTAAQFLPRLKAIWDGKPQRFGIVTLDRIGFKAPAFFASWSEVRRVVSDAQHLFVDWTGSSDWLTLRYRDVSFPYLVMAISHVMIDEHQRFPKS
jgi:hypothetical protein